MYKPNELGSEKYTKRQFKCRRIYWSLPGAQFNALGFIAVHKTVNRSNAVKRGKMQHPTACFPFHCIAIDPIQTLGGNLAMTTIAEVKT